MSERKTLLEITYHSDDDTGMYRIGEIDHGIAGILDEYLKRFGQKGKKEIISALAYLIYEVEERFRNMPKPKPNEGQSMCAENIKVPELVLKKNNTGK